MMNNNGFVLKYPQAICFSRLFPFYTFQQLMLHKLQNEVIVIIAANDNPILAILIRIKEYIRNDVIQELPLLHPNDKQAS